MQISTEWTQHILCYNYSINCSRTIRAKKNFNYIQIDEFHNVKQKKQVALDIIMFI